MRLLKPSLYSTMPCYTEPEHYSDDFSKLLLDQTFNKAHSENINATSDCSLTDILVIPQIFGNLYIGETFTSYICVHNHSASNVSNLTVKVELQTSSQKLSIPFKSNIDHVESFDSDNKFDGIIEHDVKELGNHILICIVSYVTDKQDKMSFKKFYKFNVSKPFEIQPRFPFIEHRNNLNTVLFEAQIQNVTNSHLFMEKVELFSSNDNLRIEDMQQYLNQKDDSQILNYNKFALIKPSEVKQYMFKIVFKDVEKEPKPLTIGKLDINWRNSFGEYGHLQTHPLSQTELCNITPKEIQILISDIPEKCLINEEMSFKCCISNTSDRELDLAMQLENNKNNGYAWNCKLIYQIGKLQPKKSVEYVLSLVPFTSGFLIVSGISITDLFLKRIHEFTQVANLFINTSDEVMAKFEK